MKRDVHSKSSVDAPKTTSGMGAVWLSLADTTWRVAVPTVLFSVVGIMLDKWLHTMPLCTIIGLIVGLVAAAKLVWNQLERVNKIEGNK